MQERNLIFSYEEKKCKIDGKKGNLETFTVDEILPGGQKTNLATDIYFHTAKQKSLPGKLLHFFKSNTRRAA